jgi:alpha-D-xyloside xylohydrolase
MIGAEQTGAANEVWSFGDEQYDIIRRLLFLRERLRPYVMDQMRAAHETGLPPMRPLFLDFPSDPASWPVEDQFLFGPDILVAPVYMEGARERRVYLPDGAVWRDAWTGAQLEGGGWITAAAPLDTIPVYLRSGGAVEPFGPVASLAPGESVGE